MWPVTKWPPSGSPARKGPFEIDGAAQFGELQVGAPPRFFQYGELQDFDARERKNFFNGKTAAVDCQTVAHFEAAPAETRAHTESDSAGHGTNGVNVSGLFNYSSKHINVGARLW